MFLGDLKEGELEVGQISANMDTIKPAAEIVIEIIEEFQLIKNKIYIKVFLLYHKISISFISTCFKERYI